MTLPSAALSLVALGRITELYESDYRALLKHTKYQAHESGLVRRFEAIQLSTVAVWAPGTGGGLMKWFSQYMNEEADDSTRFINRNIVTAVSPAVALSSNRNTAHSGILAP